MDNSNNPNPASNSKSNRSSYSVDFKLRVIELAKTTSCRKAARHFGIHETQARRWKTDEKNLVETATAISPKVRKHLYKRRQPKFLALEQYLKKWVFDKRTSGHQVSGTSILLEARKQALALEIDGFKGSPKWIFSFMKRNGFVRRAITSTGQNLPHDWEAKAASFREFVTCHKNGLALHQVGNMDEVPVTFDLPSNFTIEKKGTSDVKIMTTGNEKSKFTVVLCVTANGEKLPAYVIFRRKTIPAIKVPSNIVLSANEKSCMNGIETQIWAEKIWNKRKNSFFDKRCLLMLDAAPGHKTEPVLDKFKKLNTTVAMIPGGLTKKLQVLDIAVNKSFKSYLRKEWEQWMISGYHQFTKAGHIKRASYELVCQWISNAWAKVPISTILNGFRATGIHFYPDNNETDDVSSEDEEDEDENTEIREMMLDILTSYQLTDSEYESD